MQGVWDKAKESIQKRVPPHSFKMWIEPLEWVEERGSEVVLSCTNAFSKRWIIDHYLRLIEGEVSEACKRPCRVVLKVSEEPRGYEEDDHEEEQLSLPIINVRTNGPRLLRKHFTFDQFVVGNNNSFAYFAANSIAKEDRSDQNALFLISKTGLGKSHLSQAIGNHILTNKPSCRVFYITAEDFTNEMIYALRHDAIDRFKERYRKECDVLLLEDIQFLSGKEKTQQELAFTLDTLFEANKKIIFTSYYPPFDIPKMNEKLSSRLSCSIISNIEPPDFETRVRILKKKASIKGRVIPDDVIQYLASSLTDNVRQLESGLIGVLAKSTLLHVPIDLPLAESVVRNIVRRARQINIESIQKLICKYYKISPEDLVSRSRKRGIALPRQIAMYLARRFTNHSLKEIGRSFNRYHATTLYAIGTVERLIKEKGQVSKQIEFLSRKLEAGEF